MRRCYLFTIVVVSALACADALQAQQAATVGSGVPETRTGVRARGPGGLVSFKSNGSTYRLGDVEYEGARGCAVSVSGNKNALIATDVRIRDTGEDAVRVEGDSNAVVVSGAEIVRSGGFGINADGDDNVVTIIHGQVSGLRVGGSSIANLMGGPLDGKLVVGSKGTVLVYCTGLRLTGTRLEGALTDGTKVNLEVEKQEGARILLQNAAITPPMSAKTETRARPEPREPKETPRSKNAEIPEQTAALVKEIAELRTTAGQLEKQLFAGKVRNATEEQSQGKPQGLPEDLAKRRSRMILDDPDEMVDATRWGEDIPNPFAKITPEGQAKLTARGIDVKKLQAMKALNISGEHMGASSKTFVNLNPEIAVVLARGFNTHNWVYSAGPILVETASSGGRIMGSVIGAQLVWFVGDGQLDAGNTIGKPVIAALTVKVRGGGATDDIWFGDYGLGEIDGSEVVPLDPMRRPERLERETGRDDSVAAAIQRLGARVERDESKPERPIVLVHFGRATDDFLAHLKGLAALQAVYLILLRKITAICSG